MGGHVVAVTVVAAYDVRSDSRRAKLAALLQTYGDRIQLSVYLLTVTPEELLEVERRAMGLIDPENDSLYLLHQCANCWESVTQLGQAQTPTPDLYWAVL